MEYILFINSKVNIDKIADKVINILQDNFFGEVVIVNKKNDEINLYCDPFTLNINSKSDYIRVIKEESGLELNTELYMNLITNYSDVVKKTIYFTGKCIKAFDGDALLLSNGDTPIVKSQGGIVSVDSSKIESEEEFPFNELMLNYYHETIKLKSD